MDGIRLYLRSAGMVIRGQLQYRLSFALQTLAQMVMMGGEMLAVLLLFDRFSALGQWTGGDVLFFFGMMSTTFYVTETFFRGLTNFSPLVRDGALDAYLLRPRGVLFQVLCANADPRRFGAIGIGIVALVSGCIQSGVQWSLVKLLCLLASVAGGVALILGLFMIEATVCFFSIKTIEVVNVLTYGGRTACQYPIDIYPRPFRMLFMVVAPFALTTHLPASYILGKTLWNAPLYAVFLAPLSGFAFFFLMYCVFRRGLSHYRSTGS